MGSREVQDHSRLQSEVEINLSYRRPASKKAKEILVLTWHVSVDWQSYLVLLFMCNRKTIKEVDSIDWVSLV